MKNNEKHHIHTIFKIIKETISLDVNGYFLNLLCESLMRKHVSLYKIKNLEITVSLLFQERKCDGFLPNHNCRKIETLKRKTENAFA